MAKNRFRGMGPNQNEMLRQAQKMQQQMARIQEEMESKTWTASTGGGMITATVDGHHDLVALEIKPEALEEDDLDMLQDMIIAAINKAMHTSQEEIQKNMASFGGGFTFGM